MTLTLETGENNEILRSKSTPVKIIDKKLQKFIRDMGETMTAEKGVGLAAPQVGLNKRLIVVLLDNKIIVPMVNPEITMHSDELDFGEEGCLSLPGEWGQVKRYRTIRVQFQDEKGERRQLQLDDFNARVVQHEIDHLDGILFTDYLETEDNLLNAMNHREIERL